MASATITDTAFAYSGTWQTVANPSEHWTGASGATATVQFNADAGGSTFALKAHRDTSNGTISVAIDGGTPVNVNENGASAFGYTVYTSGVLAAGAHTVVLRRVSGEVSVMGATISNGTFGAPPANPSQPNVTVATVNGNARVAVYWAFDGSTVSLPGQTGWQVKRDGANSVNVALDANEYTYTGLTNGTAYTFTVAPIVNGTVGTAGTTQGTPFVPANETSDSVQDSAFTYTGNWSTTASPREHYTTDPDARATIQFTVPAGGAKTLAIRGNKAVGNGIMNVMVDGIGNNVDEAAGATVNDATVLIYGSFTEGTHTVTIRAISGRISLSAATISNGTFGSTTPPPAQPTVNATAASGDGNATLSWTVSNGPINGLTGWHVARDGVDTGGAGAWSTDLAASATAQTFLSLVNGNTYHLTVAPIVNGTVGVASTATATPTGGTTTPPPTNPPTSGGNTTGGSGGIIGGAASSSNPSGYAPPTADAFGSGYTQTISQDFNIATSEGQFGSKYPGWNGYDGVPDGNVSGLTWESAQISAANSVLTLRNSGGKAHCQAITPIIPGTGAWNTQAQKYGKYVLRFKSRGQTGYKIAFLLWPTDNNWNDGEIDFPEGNLVGDNTGMTGNSHNVTGNPVDGIYKASGVRVDDGNWHTATIEWEPNSVKFAMDGTVFSTVTNTNYIPKVNMRWDLQVETSPDQATGGTVYVDIDWMVQYKKN